MPAFRVTGGVLRGALVRDDAYPDNTLPEGPEGPVDPGWGNRPPMGGTLPEPPPGIWPPPSWGNPIGPIIDNTLPVAPGTIWPPPAGIDNTLPGAQPGGDVGISNPIVERTFWMLCYCPSLGWKYVAVDPSLKPGMPLPPGAQPK